MTIQPITHHRKSVSGTEYHWVEAGDGDAVVLLHGVPESWQCWIHQIPTLASQFRVVVPDLKGFGQSEKGDGDYTAHNVATETLRLLDEIGVTTFRLAGHDWGSIIGDHICDQAPGRVERYMRCCISLHRYDPRNTLQHQYYAENPEALTRLIKKPEAFIRTWFESGCKPELIPKEDELRTIIAEFSYPGIAEAVPRYFRDIRRSKSVDYSKLTMPVVYVHSEHDPRQPIEYAYGMEEHVPGLEGILVLDSGHFLPRERPIELTLAMMCFFNSILSSGLKLFDRSRELGLPTRPGKPRGDWGVNAFNKPQSPLQPTEPREAQ